MIDLNSFPEYLAFPKFVHALHVPGLELTRQTTEIAGLPLRRLRWVEWMVLEHGATAEALYGEFQDGLHSFAVIDRRDFCGDDAEAEALAIRDVAMLRHVVSALRLVRPGALLDPEGSMRYERRGPKNRRTPGRFGRQMFEREYTRKYVLGDTDALAACAIAADLIHPEVSDERTIQLAVRHFDASYNHTLDNEERLLHLFTSLETTFGEYKKNARPVSGATLGKSAAILWPSATRASVADFLDDKAQARGLRNAVAHGDLGGRTSAQVDADIERLREALRFGLRTLLRFSARRSSLVAALGGISTGLGALPPKAAFQHVLGHAAKGSAAARHLLAALAE
jgi:hypothetical protein